MKLSDFTLQVIAAIKKIPKGKVATYGQIARLAGKPHGARGVGWILSSSSEIYDLPWQRVLNSRGAISFSKKSKEFKEQKRLLKRDGIEVSFSGTVDLKVCQWKKEPPKPRAGKTPMMFR